MQADKIPDEIMQEAKELAWKCSSMELHEEAEEIARALMARDKRAAEIARKAGNTWSGSRDHMVAVQEAAVDDKCDEIATAIVTYGGHDEQR